MVFMDFVLASPELKSFASITLASNGAVDIAQNADYNVELAQIGWNGNNPSSTRATFST